MHMRSLLTRVVHRLPLFVLIAFVLLLAVIPATTLRADESVWNYGRISSLASPYSLRPQGASSNYNFVTYSATPGLVSGNRGYTRQIVNDDYGTHDADIAAELGITVPQLYKLRYVVACINTLFDEYESPSKYNIEKRLPAETQKRLIGPDFAQNIFYAALHEFNPVKYPAPMLWPDFVPNLCTPFTQAEIDYFLPNLDGSISPDPAALRWSDRFSNSSAMRWIYLDYCLNPTYVRYDTSSTAKSFQMLYKNGANYDEPITFRLRPEYASSILSNALFTTDNPLLAKPLFDVPFNSTVYMLVTSETNQVALEPRTIIPRYIQSESLIIEPGNQTMYQLEIYPLYGITVGGTYLNGYGVPSLPNHNISMPYSRSSVNGGKFCHVNYAKVGDSIEYSSRIKPEGSLYLYFGERPDWYTMGTEANPIPIRTAAELNAMCSAGGNKHYRLMNNIDFAGETFTSATATFGGVFDGNGYALIAPKFVNAVGLFKTVTGTVKNLSIRTPATSSATSLGGVIAQTLDVGGVIENCYIESPNYGAHNARIGGIVGMLQGGTIRGCTVEGGALKGNEYIGGIAGVIDGSKGGTIEDCQVLGVSITGTHATYAAAGIAGATANTAATTTISRCSVDAATTVTGTQRAAGIVGEAVKGVIRDCDVAATLKASTAVGGIAVGPSVAGASCTIQRCRSTAVLDLTSAASSTKPYAGGIYAAPSVASANIAIEDCEAAATYAMPAACNTMAAGGIAAANGSIAIRRCVQTSAIAYAAADPAYVAGILVGGGSVEACTAAGATLAVQQGNADAIATPLGGTTITATLNRYADRTVTVGGAPVLSPSPYGDEVALAALLVATAYDAPYNYAAAWDVVGGRLPTIALTPAAGAANALRAAPSGTTLRNTIVITFINYDLNGTRIDVSELRDPLGNPIVDGTWVPTGTEFEVRYKPAAPTTADDYFFRVNLYKLHAYGYRGTGNPGTQYDLYPDFFDGTGVRVESNQPQAARLKVVQAGENFYARPDGGTVTVQEYATLFTGAPVRTWTLQPGVGVDEVPLTSGRYYAIVDTASPTKYDADDDATFYYDTDNFYMVDPATGARRSSYLIARQKTDTDTLYVYTKHNLLEKNADDEVRRVTIEADTALYASVDGGTFDLYMYPDLTNTSTPRFLRNVKISRGALQDPEPLFPAYYKLVQSTAPAGHTVVTDPIYFKLNGEGGVLQTTTHELLPEMRGTQPGRPIIYLRAPASSDVNVHVRMLIIDSAYPNGLAWPVSGHGSIDGYQPVGPVRQDQSRNISMLAGFESMGIAYTDYQLPQTDALFPEYVVSAITPQYFKYEGYVVTTQDVPHASTALTGTGALARLDASQDDEFWVTFFVRPISDPGDNALEWRTNDFGEID